MTSQQAYQIIQYAANKSQHGYITPDNFNLLMNQAQLSFLDYLLGEYQKYQYGRPIPPVELGMTSKIRQSLSVLIDTPTTLTIDVTGFVAYPADYEQYDAMYTTAMDRVRFVQQDSLYSYLKSVIDPVATNPIFLINKNGFQFYPENIGSAKLSYIKTPPAIVWGYITDGNGRPVYSPGASIDPVWQDTDMLNIIVRALALVGINLQLGVVSQYAEIIKNSGQ